MNLELLTKLRDYLQNNPYHNLDMHLYVGEHSGNNSPQGYKDAVNCGTSTCLAGLIPLVDPEFASNFVDTHGVYRFNDMSEACAGENDPLWGWLFSPYWAYSVPLAIRRLEYIINGGDLSEWYTLYTFNNIGDKYSESTVDLVTSTKRQITEDDINRQTADFNED